MFKAKLASSNSTLVWATDPVELPKWTHVLPVLLGVGLAIGGMYGFPLIGMRNTLGPIIGMPAGLILGFVILALIAKFLD